MVFKGLSAESRADASETGFLCYVESDGVSKDSVIFNCESRPKVKARVSADICCLHGSL